MERKTKRERCRDHRHLMNRVKRLCDWREEDENRLRR
ncbi:hypothetical protein BleG1_3405 [Shouchella lehensis G1]|uniref:Uncharacterized protein n=1 Tax=Shouchella lehensis G1 TaxID=1246626 RepID=A0A060M0I3_9BACI|nr:hypothetical protein BleG1_3405 [Shouchella lehensis G1]